MSIWGKLVLDPDDMKRIRVKDLARFILKCRRFLVNAIYPIKDKFWGWLMDPFEVSAYWDSWRTIHN